MAKTTREDWRRYEEAKRRLWSECSTTAEYEQKLRELLAEMKI